MPFVDPARAAFTLAEVLAAMAVIAIVVPVAVQGLRVASLAGGVAQRKAIAARVAEQVLYGNSITQSVSQAVQSGVVHEGPYEFRWTLRNELWPIDSMRQLTAEVNYTAQNQDYSVVLTTLTSQ